MFNAHKFMVPSNYEWVWLNVCDVIIKVLYCYRIDMKLLILFLIFSPFPTEFQKQSGWV